MLGALMEERPIASSVIVVLFYAGISVVSKHDILSEVLDLFNHGYRLLCRKINGVFYLFNGADIIDQAYLRAKGQPFEINTPDRIHHMVTSYKHLDEIDRAPLDVLSLHAVAKDFLQPKQTMQGFEWQDVRGLEGTGFVRALRTILTGQLPKLIPRLTEVVENHIDLELKGCEASPGTFSPVLYDVARRLVAKTNCTVFFGSRLAEDVEFFEAAYQFPHDSSLAAEIIRLLPHSIGRFLARRATHNYRSGGRLHKYLTREITKRLAQRSHGGLESTDKPEDGLQSLIDTSPKKNPWSIDRLVGEVMGIWYGSVHTLSIAVTFALLDLYTRPQYIEPLRAELETTDLNALEGDSEELPLLDSFLRESARLSAFESTGVRRQALKKFTFSDGVQVQKGEWVCVPHRSMMRDEAYFSNALQFNGFRFVQGSSGNRDSSSDAPTKSAQLVGAEFVWGYGRIVCPGRFYATVVLKLILSTMLLKYDCEIPRIPRVRSLQWRSSIVPKRSVTMIVRERERR